MITEEVEGERRYVNDGFHPLACLYPNTNHLCLLIIRSIKRVNGQMRHEIALLTVRILKEGRNQDP